MGCHERVMHSGNYPHMGREKKNKRTGEKKGEKKKRQSQLNIYRGPLHFRGEQILCQLEDFGSAWADHRQGKGHLLDGTSLLTAAAAPRHTKR